MAENILLWIWAQQALGPASVKAAQLFAKPRGLEALYRADRAVLQDRGLSVIQLDRLCDKSLDPAKRIAEKMDRLGGFILTPDSPDYPQLLRSIFTPPLVLYGRGALPDLSVRPGIAVVGTRHAGSHGLHTARLLSAGLAAGGAVVISGGAEGIDTAAHRGALQAGGITVAVQGCGLAINYPRSNHDLREAIVQQGGCLLSELPPDHTGGKFAFPIRNRILSGLSRGICVVEAPARSGALITARDACEQGRDVFAVPGNVDSGMNDGSNELLRQGAMLVSRAEDILSEYQHDYPGILNLKKAADVRHALLSLPEPPPSVRRRPVSRAERPSRISSPPSSADAPRQCPVGVGEDARRLFSLLTAEPQPVDLLVQKMQLPTSRVMILLTELEMSGGVCACPGQLYRLP